MSSTQQQAFSFVPVAKPEAAVIDRPARRNLVIEAGAGTGKTTAIVAEVLRLLLSDEELAPERIVLVTFTEKAAGEIADRIHHALTEIELRFESGEEIAWPIGSPQPLYRVAGAERDAARRACTRQLARIDALRSQTIHSFCQSLLRQFPLEAKLDPQFKVIEGFERSLLYAELYDAWIDHETRIAPTAEGLRQWETLVEHIGYLFLIREILFSLVDRRDLLLDVRYTLGDITDAEPELINALDDIRRGGWPENIAAHVAGQAPPLGQGLDAWIDYLLPIAGEIRETKLPRKKNEQLLAEALKVLRAGDSGCAVVDRLVSHRAAVAAHALALRFIAFLDDEKRKRGVVDFDDLLLRTHEVLQDESVAERARGQFDYLFVDEFQDTDRVQARIIDRLARDGSDVFVPGRTVVVGDPKQSIYGFRRADPETYYRVTAELIAAGAEHRKIVDQYRSEPALLDAINDLFGRLFPPQLAHDPNVFRPPYHPLLARKAPAEGLPEGLPLRYLDVESDERNERQANEGSAVAAWIAAHRHEAPSDLRRFAILFRRTTYLDDYLDALDRAGIDYVLPPTKLFLDRRAPVDLLAVLRAVAYPFDRGAELSAARTPYFALTDDEIAAGILDQGPAWQTYRDAIDALRESSKHLSVAQLIDRVIASTSIEAVYAAAADGDRAQRHVEHVRAIAFAYDQKAGGSVRQFVDEIARRRHDPDEMEPSLIDEAQNAVRILTVHAAKGLEFESVILPDLDFSVKPPDAFTTEDPPSLVLRGQIETLTSFYRRAAGTALKDIGKQREEEEMKRLFYVAVTRAMREVLFVTSSGAKRQGFFKCLEMPATGIETPPVQPPGARHAARLRDAALEERLATGEIVRPAIVTPPPAVELLQSHAHARLATRAAGILLHRVLERWDGRAAVGPLLDQLAAEQGVDHATANKVRQRLAIVARSPTLARIAAAETLGRELPIAIAEDGLILERRIDRWLREPHGDLVVDYKSGQPADKDAEQVKQYCRALERMTGRPCRGLLWYIDVDRDEAVEVGE